MCDPLYDHTCVCVCIKGILFNYEKRNSAICNNRVETGAHFAKCNKTDTVLYHSYVGSNDHTSIKPGVGAGIIK